MKEPIKTAVALVSAFVLLGPHTAEAGGRCDLIPDIGCVSIYDPDKVPPIELMPVYATNYWPWNPDGTMMTAFHGQCDSDCSIMANGTPLTKDLIDQSAACISAWTRINYTYAVTLDGFGEVVCNDRFGAAGYESPFFHERLGHWVIPVDWLGERPLSHVVWNWSIRMVPAGELTD